MIMETKMARNEIRNDGSGPYAIFYCALCSKEFRSNPNVASEVTKGVGQGLFKGLLRAIPVVGYDVSNAVGSASGKTAMNQKQLEKAWAEVSANFHQCGTCGKFVCDSDWNAESDSCSEHAGAQAGVTCTQCGAQVKGAKFCPNCGAKIEEPKPISTKCSACGTEAKGAKFCPNCGAKMP
jgi:DNA-directed RNA polymerase subunit RPC12/RpoP